MAFRFAVKLVEAACWQVLGTLIYIRALRGMYNTSCVGIVARM